MNNYRQRKEIELRQGTEKYLHILPSYVTDYYLAKSIKLSAFTLSNYITKINMFFLYLKFYEFSPYKGIETKTITLEQLSQLKSNHMVQFFLWLKRDRIIERDGEIISLPPISDNTEVNYHASLRAFFNRLEKEKKISNNPMDNVDSPKEEKNDTISYLKKKEEHKFLDSVEYGSGLSAHAQKFHAKNQERDMSLCYLILYTGCRVSEVVGLDIDDIDMDECCIRVNRKGKKVQDIYFSDITKGYLMDYLTVRESKYKPSDDETALFLSRDGKRLGVRSVELLVKKYMKASNPNKIDKITPHKLRSTYAMNSYSSSHDLELVRSQLGHSSTAVTNRYAKATDERRKSVRNNLDDFEQ